MKKLLIFLAALMCGGQAIAQVGQPIQYAKPLGAPTPIAGDCLKINSVGTEGTTAIDAGAPCGTATAPPPNAGVLGTNSSGAFFNNNSPNVSGLNGIVFVVGAGSGSDDSTAINAAITTAVATGSSQVYFPTPSSGFYNICSATITLPITVSMTLRGPAGGGANIRVLPSCGSPPTTVMYQPGAPGDSSHRVRLENLTLDGYCLAAHDLDIAYSRGFSSTNTIYRNAATGGSNIRIESAAQSGLSNALAFELDIGDSNLVENMNDTGHTCYTSNTALPLYGLEMWGTDSNFSGLVIVNANTANFYEGSSAGGNYYGPGTHGWAQSTPYDLRASYVYWGNGQNSRYESVNADGFKLGGIRITGGGYKVTGAIFENGYAGTETCIILDPGVANNFVVAHNIFQYCPISVTPNGLTTSNGLIEDNSGLGPRPSIENRIINSDFAFDQYNGGAQRTVQSGYFTDRWALTNSVGQFWQVNLLNASTGCGGASTAIVLVTSGNATPSAAQIDTMQQKIDGGDIQDLLFGGNSAQPIVMSFWGRASQAGNYSVALRNGGETRTYVTTVPLTTACLYYSIKIPGDTGSGWNLAAGQTGMEVHFDLGSGTNFQTSTTNAWQSGAFVEASGSSQLSTITSGTLSINGIRIRQGFADVPRLPRSYNEELKLAREFFRKSFATSTAPAQNAGLVGAVCVKTSVAASYVSTQVSLVGVMRKAPTVTLYNPSAANGNWRDVTAAADVGAAIDPSTAIGASGFEIVSTALTTTAGDNLCIQYTANGEF